MGKVFPQAARVLMMAALGVLTSGLSAAALTIEQAIELSEQTGRPILAVAGSDT